MRYVVLDLETNIRNSGDTAVGDMLASPFHVDNHIVSMGEAWLDKQGNVSYKAEYDPDGVVEGQSYSKALGYAGDKDEVLIIGHNISFDLLYLMKEFPTIWDSRRPYIYIWDTAQVEYLLEGQRHMYPSLDECCIKRDLPVKDDRIKEFWAQGIDTSLIPKDMLLDYMRADVFNTLALFQDQWKAVSARPKLLELVKAKMDDILMTTLMTKNGMHFNLETAQKNLEPLDKELGEVYAYLKTNGQQFFPANFEYEPGSPKQLSTALFGGEYATIEDLPVMENGEEVRYKGGARKGQVKTKKTKVIHHTDGFGLSTKGIPASSRDGYSTAEEHLVKLKKSEYVTKLLRFRELTKDTETYYRGYSKLVWPDGKIHPQRNHTSTVTGRLSCSAPNLENVSKPDED